MFTPKEQVKVAEPEIFKLDGLLGFNPNKKPVTENLIQTHIRLDKIATLIKLSARASSRSRSKSRSELKSKSKCSHDGTITPSQLIGDTSRFSQCPDCGENVLGIPLEPPFILKSHEFEQMQKKEIEYKKKVLAGKILPSYKHNVETEVKLQMVLLSELYGIKKALVPQEPKIRITDTHGHTLKRQCKRQKEALNVDIEEGENGGAVGQQDQDQFYSQLTKRQDTQNGSRLRKQQSHTREERLVSSSILNKSSLKANGEQQQMKSSNTLYNKVVPVLAMEQSNTKRIPTSGESRKMVTYQKSPAGSLRVRKYQNAPVEVAKVGELQVSMANSTNGQLLIKDLVKFNNFQKELDKIGMQNQKTISKHQVQMNNLKEKTGCKNGHSYYGIIKYGPNDVSNIVNSNNGSQSKSPKSSRSKSYFQRITSKEKKSSTFVDRYLKIRETKAVSTGTSPIAPGKIFKKSQRHLIIAQKKNKQMISNQITIVENSILTGTPRENGPHNKLSQYKNLMSFKNSKSNEQLKIARNLDSSVNHVSSKNISLGTEQIMFSSIGSQQQLPLHIETSSPPQSAMKLQCNVQTSITNKTQRQSYLDTQRTQMTMFEEDIKTNVRGQRPQTSRNVFRVGKNNQISKRYIQNLNSRLSERSVLPGYSNISSNSISKTVKNAIRYRSNEKPLVPTEQVPKNHFSSHLKDLNTVNTVFNSYQQNIKNQNSQSQYLKQNIKQIQNLLTLQGEFSTEQKEWEQKIPLVSRTHRHLASRNAKVVSELNDVNSNSSQQRIGGNFLTSYRYQSRLKNSNGNEIKSANLQKHFSNTMESNFFIPLSQKTAEDNTAVDITPIQKNLTLGGSSRQSSENNNHMAFISQNIKSEQFSSMKKHVFLAPSLKKVQF